MLRGAGVGLCVGGQREQAYMTGSLPLIITGFYYMSYDYTSFII